MCYREYFKRAHRDSRVMGQVVFIHDQTGRVEVAGEGARRSGPNGRAYAASVLNHNVRDFKTSIGDRGRARSFGVMVHVRAARTWASWAKLP